MEGALIIFAHKYALIIVENRTKKNQKKKIKEKGNQRKIEIIFYSLHINKHNEYNY
tara:strand:+ start:1148 stop:1315 length:168 start_codon:yes stop_codon:yes gene_type:complete